MRASASSGSAIGRSASRSQTLGAPGALPGADAIGGARFFFERVAGLLIDYEWQSIPLMLKNGLRFVVWQNPLLLPLAALSGARSSQDRRYARELLAGVLLTFGVMGLLMPFQGHGWGYRYLHGLIGNLALLAGFGWISATREATARESAAMRAALFVSSAFSLLVLLPAHLESARALTRPYALADAALRHAKSDIVVIDKTGMRYGVDFARNDPFLRERPIRLMLHPLSDADLAALCARYSIELFDAADGAAFGVPLNEEELARRPESRAARPARRLSRLRREKNKTRRRPTRPRAISNFRSRRSGDPTRSDRPNCPRRRCR